MKKQSKSQAAIFLILGLVLIIMVVSLLMLGRFASKKVSRQETIDSKETAFDIQPINNYITECTTTVTEEAVKIMGQQGGYLYKSQGGSLIDYQSTDEGIFYLKHKDSNVAYNILKPRFPIGKYSPNPPAYPWSTFPYENDQYKVLQFKANSAFGTNNVPVINKSFGKHSMQEQITRYVEQNIDLCLEDSVFENLGVSVSRNEKEVQVDINENDVVIRLLYDLEVTNLVTEVKTNVNSFITEVPVRLGAVRAFVNNLVENDIGDIKYNIENDTAEDGFLVNLIRDHRNQDDLIIVTDLQTKINDREFEYVFARKNRPPALFYIPDKTLPRFNPVTGAFTEITNHTLFGPSGVPAILDPDEDVLDHFTITPRTPVQFIFPDLEFDISVSDGEAIDNQLVQILRGTNSLPSLTLPDLEMLNSINAQQLIIPDITVFAEDAETPKENLQFRIASQSNNGKASCNIQNNKQLFCISHNNKRTNIDVTIEVNDGQGKSQDSLILHVVETYSTSTCGDRICHFATEGCDVCPQDCGVCPETGLTFMRKCGHSPQEVCNPFVSCPPGLEFAGSIDTCKAGIGPGSWSLYNCYSVRITDTCSENPSCNSDEVAIEDISC